MQKKIDTLYAFNAPEKLEKESNTLKGKMYVTERI